MSIVDLERLLDTRGWAGAADCRRFGVSSDVVSTRVRRRQWERIRRGLYVRPDATAAVRAAAVVASVPGGALAGASAAWWHGLITTAPRSIMVITDVDHRARPSAGLLVTRTRHLCDQCLTTLRGVVAVRLERAVLDHARSQRRWSDAEAFVTGAVQQGRTTGPRLESMADHLGRRSSQLRELLDHICRGSRSSPEIDFIRVVRRFALPEPERNVPLLCDDGATRYADLAYPEHGYYIEIDGRICHFAVTDWERDLLRMNEISISCPLRPLRFTSRQLRLQPEVAANQVARALGVER